MIWTLNPPDERLRAGRDAIRARYALRLTLLMALLAPGMMWIMGTLRGQTFSLWVYAALEVILLGSCLLGGVLAQKMKRRSGRNADVQLQEAEGSDEE